MACMDTPQPSNTNPLALKWRGMNAWNSLSLYMDPYGFSVPGPSFTFVICTMYITCHALRMIRMITGSCSLQSCTLYTYAWQGACIPCDAPDSDWDQVCSYGQAFNRAACGLDGGNSLSTVCNTCSFIQDTISVSGLVSGMQNINLWMNARPGWSADSVVCKYLCNVGYSSNPDPNTYASNPCLHCQTEIQNFAANGICPGGPLLLLLLISFPSHFLSLYGQAMQPIILM